jgi:hypothetical protein
MFLPDYHGGSLVNLMASITAGLGRDVGAAGTYVPLAELAPDIVAGYRNVVLMVVDGLGYEHLQGAQAGGLLRRHLRRRLTSVFPSTTASAITTFLTGQAPQQHALTGWHMYLRELGCVAAVLPFRPRHGGPSFGETGVRCAEIFGLTPVFDRLDVESWIVSPAHIIRSDFNTAHSGRAGLRGYHSPVKFFDAVVQAVRTSDAPKYVYAYYPELDRTAHELGIGSDAAAAQLDWIDRGLEALLDRLAGSSTLIVLTADHGFIDTAPEREVELDRHPELAAVLMAPLCGERRAAYCYVQSRDRGRFENYVTQNLQHCATLYPSEELVARGWFGLGQAHPRLGQRIGDYTLVMKENWVIKDWLPGERRYTQVGVHGGVSSREMHVPLVVAEA